MPLEIQSPRGWNTQRCRFVSESYLDRFLQFVAEEATAGEEGIISAAQLSALAERFRQSDAGIEALFQDSFFACNQARQNKERDDKRQNQLGRLVVEQISPLFVEAGGNNPKDGGLSREVLPGLFHALELAIGTGPLRDYQQRCTTAVERLRASAGEGFEWDDYFRDSQTQDILIDVLIDLTRSFADFERRKEWFIDLINKGMADDDASGQRTGPDWRFGDRHFTTLCAGFFRPLAEAMIAAEDRVRIADRFGSSELDNIKAFLIAIV